MTNLALDQCPNKHANDDHPPRWLVIWTGLGEHMQSQRRSWGADMKRIADILIGTGQWVIYREGDAVTLKHRCQLPQA